MNRPKLLLLAVLAFPFVCVDFLRAEQAAREGGFNVRKYGAAGDGKQLDSPAIDRAIEAAAAAGGGTVFVPAGTYLSGTIHLKNHINLHLDAGATILAAPQEMNAYDETEPFEGAAYQDGGHTYFHNSLIVGVKLKNVSITGRGTIHGEGLDSNPGILDKMAGHRNFKHPEKNTETYPPVRIGNKAIALKLCTNVLIRDVTMLHGGHFAILATGCDNLTIDNVTIDTNRDGMDIDCCRNTIISNCRVNSPNDDGICLKSSYALGEIRFTENLTITNCQVSGFKEGTLVDGTMQPSKRAYGRIKFGTESSGGFRNCTVSNCTFRSCLGLALEEVDGGLLENITITNLTMMDARDYGIYLTTGKRNRTPNLKTTSRMRNIHISNVVADSVGKLAGIQIMGMEEEPIQGVRISNIRLTSKGGGTDKDAAIQPRELGEGYPEPKQIGMLPAYGIFARHFRDLHISDVHVDFEKEDRRPAAVFVNGKGLVIDNFTPKVADGVKAVVLAKDVKEVSIRNSPALKE